MNKQEFLSALKAELEKRNVKNVNEVLADYEEHFAHGLEKGLSEHEISAKLGQPSVLAQAFETEVLISQIKSAEHPFKIGMALSIIGRLLVLAPFNFFFLFIPGVVGFALLTAGWSVSLAIAGVGFKVLTTSLFHFGIWAVIAGFSTSFALLGIAVMMGIVMFLISKYVLLAVINYLQWNLKFVMEK